MLQILSGFINLKRDLSPPSTTMNIKAHPDAKNKEYKNRYVEIKREFLNDYFSYKWT